MRKILGLLALLGIPALAGAHVKWFAEPVEYVRPYQITDKPVLIWIAISVVLVLIGVFLEKKLEVPKWIRSHEGTWGEIALSVASMGFGLAFLIFSYHGFIFAPNLPAEGGLGPWMLFIQTLAGLMLLFGFYERFGAVLVFILFVLGVKQFGFHEMADTLEMLGFAVYGFIIGRPKFYIEREPWAHMVTIRLKEYAVPLLRVGTGLNLMILGFSEKIFATSLTHNFLMEFDWNFMQNLGFVNFTDYWFAFSAGMVELLFGLFLVLGLVTRLTTLVLALFLITTLILLGPIELIGHLPHFSIAIVLLVLGSGERLKIVNNRKR